MGIAILIGCSREAERDATRQASAELQRSLSRRAPSYVMAHHDGAAIWKTLRRFYAERRYEPAWIDGTRPRPQIDALLRALDQAERDGLDPQLYDLGPLSDARAQVRTRWFGPDGFEPDQIAPTDLRLTAAWLAYASDLANGVTARPHGDPMWKIKPRSVDPLPLLKNALDGNAVEQSLRDLAPSNDEYRRLADARERYRALAQAGGWPTLPSRLTLKPNQRSPHVATLAKRLAANGDLPPRIADAAPSTYDSRIQDAVRRFRARHGLGDAPTLTRDVVAAMNVPIATRIRQIEMNMERWRWFPRDLGERHIRVNVPEYQMELWEGGRPVLPMKVIVGSREKPTPIFSDKMTTIVFSPYWNVPSSIAEEETLPAVLNDPEFLTKNNIEVISTSGEVVDPSTIDWDSHADEGQREEEEQDEEKEEEDEEDEQDGQEFPYRFRQRPGTRNSLGLVKFLFPNAFDVYLHDTPAGSLFGRSFRALSHGCVRLEQPVKLAEYLLGHDPKWDTERIQQAMHHGEEEHVKLPRPVAVHLMYWTARVDENGDVSFFRDIYRHDARQWSDYQTRIARVKKQKAELRNAEITRGSRPASSGGAARPAGGE
jgi:murein L,D-transpeptidase YcbB/YkuD